MIKRRFFLGAAGAAAGTAAIATATGGFIAGGERRAPDGVAVSGRGGIPNVPLLTHEGKDVLFYDDQVKGKTVLISFIYTRCADLCPLNVAMFKRVYGLLGDRMGKDVFFNTITLDPRNDTAQILGAYARAFEAGPGWSFLTGTLESTETLRKSFGFVDPDPVLDANKELHMGMCWLGHEPLSRWSACPAMTKASAIARYINWADPKGERPRQVLSA